MIPYAFYSELSKILNSDSGATIEIGATAAVTVPAVVSVSVSPGFYVSNGEIGLFGTVGSSLIRGTGGNDFTNVGGMGYKATVDASLDMQSASDHFSGIDAETSGRIGGVGLSTSQAIESGSGPYVPNVTYSLGPGIYLSSEAQISIAVGIGIEGIKFHGPDGTVALKWSELLSGVSENQIDPHDTPTDSNDIAFDNMVEDNSWSSLSLDERSSFNNGFTPPNFSPINPKFNLNFDEMREFAENNRGGNTSGNNRSRRDSDDSRGNAKYDLNTNQVTGIPDGGVQVQTAQQRNRLVADNADSNNDGRISRDEAIRDGVGTGLQMPILLDLDGDGLEITTLGTSTSFFDMTGDGLQNSTAWAGAGDGVLAYDANNDGVIDQTNEIDFTMWDPTAKSDIEALRNAFDSSHDGKRDAEDDDWALFKVVLTHEHEPAFDADRVTGLSP